MFRDKQQLVICAAIAVIVSGFVWFQYLPMKKTKKALRSRKLEQTLTITRSMKESKKITVVEENLKQLRRTVGDYEAAIPAEKSLGVFLHRLADLMSEHDLRDQVVQPGKEMEMEKLMCIPLDMQCKGKLKHILEFFRRMRKLQRLVRIMHVTLTNDHDFNGDVTMKTKAAVYYRTERELRLGDSKA